jgi:hypothetical protein
MEVNPTLWTPRSGCHVTRDVPLLRKADTVTLRDMDSVTRHARGHVRMSRTTSRALSSRWPEQFSRFVPHVPLSTAAGRALHFKDEKTCTPGSLKTKATPVATPRLRYMLGGGGLRAKLWSGAPYRRWLIGTRRISPQLVERRYG